VPRHQNESYEINLVNNEATAVFFQIALGFNVEEPG